MTTIYDIAVEAKVSTATVSRVINSPELVAEKTRRKVNEAIKKLNYAPNALARELVTKSTNLIGMLIPDIANSYSPAVIDSFVAVCEAAGYNIFISITGADPQRELDCIDIMLKKRVEGIIILGTRLLRAGSNDRIAALSRQIPIVVVDYFEGCKEVCCVRCDERMGAFYATEYLLSLGHRRIALINGGEEYTSYHYKKLGYEDAMRKHGAALKDEYMLSVKPYFDGGFEAATRLLSQKDPPSALFVSGDQMAVGACSAIKSRGLDIPGDISVVGFSGSPISKAIYPPLSTVSQFAAETGKAAAEIMLKKMNGGKAEGGTVFKPELVRRSSCGPVK